ncbi:RidA family protein [Mesorhizobium sp. ANAO-SY3R2]|uniref:RidA family protein n=1 Tax=Mesorhizobium sp. ANAO-SY3R2 TaxID=3166644 RepID=UPI00366ABA5B
MAAGPFIKTAGMVALDVETGQLAAGGVGAQARCILSNLWSVMADLGLEVGHMVSATVYVSDFDSFGDLNQVWDEFFSSDDVPPPARTSVGVSALPLGAAVEMEFLFYASQLVLPSERERSGRA